jgi:hypothetical protein
MFGGMSAFVAGAGVLCLIGALSVLLEVQSPSFVQWSGIKVHATTQGGIAYYTYQGQSYAIDNRHASVSDQRKVPTTVWLKRSDPTDSTSAYVENAYNRWVDFGFTVGWFILAFGLLAAGFIRGRLRYRRRVRHMGEFGTGISDEVVRRLLAERHQRVPRRFSPDDD